MLDTVTTHPATPAPRRCWTDDEDVEAIMLHGMGTSDDEIGRRLGRSAKAVHHRRLRINMLAGVRPVRATPVACDLARAAATIDAAGLALDAAHRRYAEVMAPYVRAIAGALRQAGTCAMADDATDLAQGGRAWELVEALVQLGIELRVP